jgi:hypothetical protein
MVNHKRVHTLGGFLVGRGIVNLSVSGLKNSIEQSVVFCLANSRQLDVT